MNNFEQYIEEIKILDDVIEITINQKANVKINLEIKRFYEKKYHKKVKLNLKNKKIEKKVIAFMSGKGGVGKTTLACDYALNSDKKVILLDFDIYGYSIPEILNLNAKLKYENGKIIPVSYQGIDIVSIQFLLENKNEAIILRSIKINQVIKELIEKIDFSIYDEIIIDTPPGTGDINIDLNNYFLNVNYYIVTTPRKLDQKISLRTKEIGDKLNYNFLGFIINEAYYQYNGKKLYIYGNDFLDEIKKNIVLEKKIIGVSDEK